MKPIKRVATALILAGGVSLVARATPNLSWVFGFNSCA
jgi:hypothetical protein